MIRPATTADLPQLLELGKHFLEAPEYSGKLAYRPEILANFASGLLANPAATILANEDDDKITGMLALLIYAHPFSGETTAMELCWWMEPESRGSGGLKLLKAAEKLAREAGATRLMLGAPSQRTEELYQRLGLERVEVTYQRQL